MEAMSYQNKYAANKLKFDFYEGANYYNCLSNYKIRRSLCL